MKRKFFTLLVLLCTSLFVTDSTSPQAQQQSQQPQQQSQQEPAEDLQPAEIEAPANTPEDNDLILADIDPDEEEDTLRNGRFIPTEEISQDLGVSFPVDI